jgi:D-amino-acid dehydrogenase
MQEVIVIGAGILGASTAYHLTKTGVKVTIVDRKDAGQATDAAAGIICPWLSQRRNKAWYHLVKGGARYYPELVEQLKEDGEEDTSYKRVGAICLHTDREKLMNMEERARKRREDAPEIGEIQLLTQEETQKLFPPLSSEYASLYVSGGARVDGRKLRDALLRAAIKRGASFIQGNARLLVEANRTAGIVVEGKSIYANQVIVTAGAWAKELFQSLHITLKVTHQKGQIVHLQLEDNNTGDWPVVMPPNDQYILSFENGQVVIGTTHEDDEIFDTRVTAGGIHEILEKGLRIAPGLNSSALLDIRVGFRPYTPGFLPIIGPMPEVEGLFVANGLGASGLTAGPYLGKELAKLVIGDPLEIDLGKYNVDGAIEYTSNENQIK